MADNVVLNAGSGGATAASDDIGGVQYQRVKLTLGADGVNDGDASSTNPIPTSINKFKIIASSSSTTPLAGNATWTSAEFDSSTGNNGILFMCQASIDGTVYLEEKVTGAAYIVTAYSPVLANTPFAEQHVAHGDTWRIRFVNNAVAQTTFQIKAAQTPFANPWTIKLDQNGNYVQQLTAWNVQGAYTDNSASPIANKGLQVLSAIASASHQTKTEGNLVSLTTDLNGNLRVITDLEGTPTITRVAQSATSVTLIAQNLIRKSCVIHNDSTSTLYLKYGLSASTTSYTYKIRPDSIFEMPANVAYTGAIGGIWDAAGGGAAQVTDMEHA
jgi:hypothetical protein